MRLLLDTNVALWAITADSRLGERARETIADRRNTVTVSVASLWEIAIEHALRRERMPVSSHEAHGYFLGSGYHILYIRPEHALRVETLPAIHADPFDRILIAQALEEGCHLVTGDSLLSRYSDLVIAV